MKIGFQFECQLMPSFDQSFKSKESGKKRKQEKKKKKTDCEMLAILKEAGCKWSMVSQITCRHILSSMLHNVSWL